MKKTFFYFSLLLSLGGLGGCTDNISVDVEKGQTQLSVDGEITDQPGPYTIKLAETVYAFGSDTPPAVTGATVQITDNQGKIEALQETSAGVYQTRTLRGVVGNRYTLTIQNTRFGNYTAQTEIRRPIPIDSLYGEYQETFPGETSGGYLIKYNYTDPAGLGDSFRAKIYQNDKLLNEPTSLAYVEDRYNDGSKVTNVVAGRPKKFNKGDKATITLLSLTPDAYQFLKELEAQTNNGGLFANPPANVRTNIVNTTAGGKKAVGYFFGSAVRSKSAVVQ
jgi:Domain of unknown function (DUF4249)